MTAGIPAIYAHLQTQGWQVEREHLLVRGFPVQFLAAHGLTEEGVREAERIEYEGVTAKVFRAEHIVAIAASVGRAKDKARIEQKPLFMRVVNLAWLAHFDCHRRPNQVQWPACTFIRF